jgi:hypothetical protein
MAQHGVHKNIAASLFFDQFINLHTLLRESSQNFEFLFKIEFGTLQLDQFLLDFKDSHVILTRIVSQI